MAPHANHIWVAAGPGGNGADGLHAAAHLATLGKRLTFTVYAAKGQRKSVLNAALRAAQQAGCQPVESPLENQPDLVIDALLGLGCKLPMDDAIDQAMRMIQQLPVPCLSLDVPTGLDPDTGQRLAEHAVRATATLSLLTLKPGLLMASGRDAAGSIWLDTLIEASKLQAVAPVGWTIASSSRRSVNRSHDSHKGTFGDVVLVGGAAGMGGALRLCAHAALAAGVGRVMAISLDPDFQGLDVTRPECMWRRLDELASVPLEHSTVVVGCGGGKEVAQVLPALIQRSARLLLDADGLNALAQRPWLQEALHARMARDLATVLTPHPLEAARLLGCSTREVQSNRVAAARGLSLRFMATTLLKGSGTVIATPGRDTAINTTGNAALASGGTGDVLSGWLAGRWATAPRAQTSRDAHIAHDVACESAFLHGLAADRQVRTTVRALDLVEQLHELAN